MPIRIEDGIVIVEGEEEIKSDTGLPPNKNKHGLPGPGHGEGRGPFSSC